MLYFFSIHFRHYAHCPCVFAVPYDFSMMFHKLHRLRIFYMYLKLSRPFAYFFFEFHALHYVSLTCAYPEISNELIQIHITYISAYQCHVQISYASLMFDFVLLHNYTNHMDMSSHHVFFWYVHLKHALNMFENHKCYKQAMVLTCENLSCEYSNAAFVQTLFHIYYIDTLCQDELIFYCL